jgi:hypothetical protein
MLNKIYTGAALGSAVIALAGSGAWAAPILWSPTHTGSAIGFNYTNGQTTNGLFGSHTLTASTFSFTPSGFIANAALPLQGRTTTDRLSVRLDANTPAPLQTITITESGTWKIVGTGQVKVFGSLFATRLDPTGFGTRWNDTLKIIYKEDTDDTSLGVNLVTLNSNPVGSANDIFKEGVWTASVQLNLASSNVNTAQIVLDNILQAASSTGQGSSSQIAKTGFTLTAVVPEPTSVALLGIAGLALMRRHRRHNHYNPNL